MAINFQQEPKRRKKKKEKKTLVRLHPCANYHLTMYFIYLTGVQVISAETTVIRMYIGAEEKLKEKCFTHFTYKPPEGGYDYFLFIIRLCISGSYYEPQPEMLPPVPDIEVDKCCVAS